MSKQLKAITLSCVTVMVCLALLVVGTYALFSYQATITNHLQAGELKMELVRTKLVSNTLGTDGLPTESTNNVEKDFTTPSTANLFDLDASKDKIAPGCSFTADLLLKNKGDVAVNWYLEIVLHSDNDEALAGQLELTITINDKETSCMLSDLSDLQVGSVNSPLGQIVLNAEQAFTVKVEFVNLTTGNNAAMNQNVSFDLVVHAIQAIA